MVKPFTSHVQRGIFSWDLLRKHAEWVEIFKKDYRTAQVYWLFVCLIIDSLYMFTKYVHIRWQKQQIIILPGNASNELHVAIK